MNIDYDRDYMSVEENISECNNKKISVQDYGKIFSLRQRETNKTSIEISRRAKKVVGAQLMFIIIPYFVEHSIIGERSRRSVVVSFSVTTDYGYKSLEFQGYFSQKSGESKFYYLDPYNNNFRYKLEMVGKSYVVRKKGNRNMVKNDPKDEIVKLKKQVEYLTKQINNLTLKNAQTKNEECNTLIQNTREKYSDLKLGTLKCYPNCGPVNTDNVIKIVFCTHYALAIVPNDLFNWYVYVHIFFGGNVVISKSIYTPFQIKSVKLRSSGYKAYTYSFQCTVPRSSLEGKVGVLIVNTACNKGIAHGFYWYKSKDVKNNLSGYVFSKNGVMNRFILNKLPSIKNKKTWSLNS